MSLTIDEKELLTEILSNFYCVADRNNIRIAIETLITIHRNILFDLENTKFRKIRIDNAAFQKKVWSIYPARQFMYMCGWFEVHDSLIFSSDEKLKDIIDILVEHRNVMPVEQEWVAETKIVTENESKKKEDELKQKAALEREKELAKFKKEKQDREEIAKNIKAEIEADNRRRKNMASAEKTED